MGVRSLARPECLSGIQGINCGYAPVSTDDQNAGLQKAALRKAGFEKILTDDSSSGATTKRHALLRCLKALKRYLTLAGFVKGAAGGAPPNFGGRLQRLSSGSCGFGCDAGWGGRLGVGWQACQVGVFVFGGF